MKTMTDGNIVLQPTNEFFFHYVIYCSPATLRFYISIFQGRKSRPIPLAVHEQIKGKNIALDFFYTSIMPNTVSDIHENWF